MSSSTDTDATVKKLMDEVASLRHQLSSERYYASHFALEDDFRGNVSIPANGRGARQAMRLIKDVHELDYSERLNTSSYVNVSFEPEEFEVAKLGMKINLADQTVYPASFKLHDTCVNMVANLWHCPEPADFAEKGVHAGAQTVGSTEACLLAGLCLKFRWRAWYSKKYGKTADEVLCVRPNMVISTAFQACWEKFFKYMDIEPRLVSTSIRDMVITTEGVKQAIDENTIGVCCIMGNHYAGQYDDVGAIDKLLTEINKEKGFEIGIHVDAASGGFVAPYQKDVPAWDFRLPNVLSINASGHKFGCSVCGTGWVIWRSREGLSEHVAISVSYLGGKGESYTLNFSRPASGVYVQFYKFLRLGHEGYGALESNTMANAKFIRDKLKAMQKDGTPRFEILDAGDSGCLPVVAARLNPELRLPYDDIDFQHALSEDHWYVSGYNLSMNHPVTEEKQPLFNDADIDGTMFRIVVKSNLTRYLATDLIEKIEACVEKMDVSRKEDIPPPRQIKRQKSDAC